MNDTYKSELREGMKKSMAEPYKPTNRVQPQNIHMGWLVLFSVVIFSLGVWGIYAFDHWEAHHRYPVVIVP